MLWCNEIMDGQSSRLISYLSVENFQVCVKKPLGLKCPKLLVIFSPNPLTKFLQKKRAVQILENLASVSSVSYRPVSYKKACIPSSICNTRYKNVFKILKLSNSKGRSRKERKHKNIIMKVLFMFSWPFSVKNRGVNRSNPLFHETTSS